MGKGEIEKKENGLLGHKKAGIKVIHTMIPAC